VEIGRSVLRKVLFFLLVAIFLTAAREEGYPAEKNTPGGIPVFVGDVIMVPEAGAAIIYLVTEERDRYLPITIGHFEATAILRSLASVSTPRPMTHDLILHAISAMGGQVISVTITSLDEGTFKALLRIGLESGSEVSLDARPSDSIAIALRAGAGMYVSPFVMDQAGEPLKKESEGDDRDDPLTEEPGESFTPPKVFPETIL